MKRNLSNLSYTSSSSSRRDNIEIPLAESTAIASDPPDVFRGRKKIGTPLANQRNQRLKIDKRVLTDAQSPGIVSRLVKYYDESQNEVAAAERNRNVYKVGEFPIVHLKKTSIKRSISKNTNVRIAPPNRTVYNRDMRAAIMRSNSFPFKNGVPRERIQPVKMRAKDDSHQIITNHEPIIDESSAFSASSKSVLDALEKNCRKRINNEELILESSKKFCMPIVAPVEAQETPPPPSPPPPAVITPPSAKRSRERASPPNKNNSSFEERIRHLKKLKTRNNAVLSSLSSSHYELISGTPQSAPQLSETLPNSFFNQSPVIQKEIVVVEKIEVDAAPSIKDITQEVAQVPKKLHLFNRKPDPNAKLNRAKFRLYDTDDEDELPIKFVKPRELEAESMEDQTKVENAKLKRMLAGLTPSSPFRKIIPKDQVDDPVASISFSTTTSSSSSSTAPILSTTTTSVSSTSETTTSSESDNLPVPVIVSSAVSGLTGILKTSKTTTAESSQASPIASIARDQEKKDAPGFQFPALNTSQTKAHVTFGSLPTLAQLKESENSQAPTVASTSSETSGFQAMPSIGGFQFGLKPQIETPTSSAVSSTPSAVVSSAKPRPLSPLALFSSPAASAKISSEIPTTTATGIGFSFNSNKPLTSSAVFGSTTTASSGFNIPTLMPQIPVAAVTQSAPSFNFGVIPSTKEKSLDKPSFAFGASNIATIKPTQSFTGSNSSASIEALKPSFSFGNTTAASANNFAPKSTAPPSFGSNSSITTSAFGPPSNTSSGSTGINTNQGSTFAFNSNQSTSLSATTTPSSAIFGGFNASPSVPVFGGANSTNLKAASSSIFSKNVTSPVFGSNTKTSSSEAQKSSFSFGGNNSALSPPSSGQSIFGGSQQQQQQQSAKPSFNFGSNTATVAPFSGLNTAPPIQDTSKSAFSFTTSNAPPAFGSSSAPAFGSNEVSQKASFSFNNPTQQPSFPFPGNQQQASPFGTGLVQTESTSNFGGGGGGNQMPNMVPSSPSSSSAAAAAASGLFNIGTAGQQQQRKPFRTASRRMK